MHGILLLKKTDVNLINDYCEIHNSLFWMILCNVKSHHMFFLYQESDEESFEEVYTDSSTFLKVGEFV